MDFRILTLAQATLVLVDFGAKKSPPRKAWRASYLEEMSYSITSFLVV